MKRNHNFLLLAASFFALFSSVEVAAQTPAPVTLVKAGQTARFGLSPNSRDSWHAPLGLQH